MKITKMPQYHYYVKTHVGNKCVLPAIILYYNVHIIITQPVAICTAVLENALACRLYLAYHSTELHAHSPIPYGIHEMVQLL